MKLTDHYYSELSFNKTVEYIANHSEHFKDKKDAISSSLKNDIRAVAEGTHDAKGSMGYIVRRLSSESGFIDIILDFDVIHSSELKGKNIFKDVD